MNVRNCRKCGKIFNYVAGPPVCPKCREALEEKFQVAKDYIRENKKATLTEISEECDVEISQIRQWVREERLCFSDDSPIGIDCEGCGAIIKTGQYCEKCKVNLIQGFKDSIKKPEMPLQKKKKADAGAKMRFLDN